MASVSAMLPARRVLQRRCLTPPCARPLPVPLSRNKRDKEDDGQTESPIHRSRPACSSRVVNPDRCALPARRPCDLRGKLL